MQPRNTSRAPRGAPTQPARNAPMPSAVLAGAVDLSSLNSRPAAAAPAPSTSPEGTIVDVTEASFTADVIERSRQVPVVLDFWADWCQPCKQFSPVIEKLAGEGGGAWVLARIDVDSNQALAAAVGVQSIPAVKAIIDGQIVGEFTGVMPEPQLRQWITALLDAVASVRAGEGPGGGEPGGGEPGAPKLDDRILAAEEALRQGDAEAAEAGYRAVLAESPGDLLASAGLAQVDLFRRVAGVTDPRTVLAAAAAHPDDLEAQLLAADVELLSGNVEQSFARLVGCVRGASGADRDAARTRLLSLFAVLPPEDPRVAKARRDLTAALF